MSYLLFCTCSHVVVALMLNDVLEDINERKVCILDNMHFDLNMAKNNNIYSKQVMLKLITNILAGIKEFPYMSKRKKLKFAEDAFSRFESSMTRYLADSKNKDYYLKNIDILKSIVMVILESNDTNYIQIPTDRRILKLLNDFNQHQVSEETRQTNEYSEEKKNKQNERKSRSSRSSRKKNTKKNERYMDDTDEDETIEDYVKFVVDSKRKLDSDSFSEISDESSKKNTDTENEKKDEVQSYFEINN